jgi:hypothetical protein
MKIKSTLLISFLILISCQKNQKTEKSKAEEKVISISQITTNYDTLINRVKKSGNEDAYYELFYGFKDSNETERTDSLMIYSKIMAEKYNYEKAYFDYFEAFCEKNNMKVDFSNYSTININLLEKKSKKDVIEWLNLMLKRKIITEENYKAIKK